MKTPKGSLWCDYCNAHISPAGVRGCVRKTCETKAKLPDNLAKAPPRKPYGRW